MKLRAFDITERYVPFVERFIRWCAPLDNPYLLGRLTVGLFLPYVLICNYPPYWRWIEVLPIALNQFP